MNFEELNENVFEKMHDGRPYNPGVPELMKIQNECLQKLHEFNKLSPADAEGIQAAMQEMFAEVGENCYITPPFYANFGGRHIHFGKGVYCNFGVTMVDDTHIYVGDYTQFGPNVTVATAAHSLMPELRGEVFPQYNKPVRIGEGCWIGAGAIIVPGVTIGDHSVIGAGSVVTKDIPANVVAYGNPCRVQKYLSREV